ncbi:MAG: hypothetical protein ABIT58_01540 [Ferruginibacter sp.]
MQKKIVVSFSPLIDPTLKATILEKVNKVLEPIHKDVTDWNGFIDYVESSPGYFVTIAKCDNEEIREMMQLLLDDENTRAETIKHKKIQQKDNRLN